MRSLKLIFVIFVWALVFAASGQAQSVQRIDPPHWWVGMEHDTLELLLYGRKLDRLQELKTEHPGVELLDIESLPNPNYALVRIRILENASPGSVEFRLAKKSKALFSWTLKPHNRHKPRGLEPHDVLYLITPDRFANARPENDVSAQMRQKSVNRADEWARHGGDIEGIISKLDYLDDLGISALWSTPLLENDQPQASYHGYAITDFYKVDPRFGQQSDLKRLSDELHRRNMKHIFDMVYNHCGSFHPFETNPPSKDWINRWPQYTQTNYRAEAFIDPHASNYDRERFQNGWFVPEMPDLNQRDPHLANYLIQNTLWWIEEAELDGIRIDTYAYPDQEFMNRLVRELRREHPGFYLTGELWVHGGQIQSGWTNNPALGAKASALPYVLDFQFCFGLQDMMRQKPDWAKGMGRFYLSLAGDWLYQDPFRMITFADNHDMGRISGLLKGDVDRIEDALGVLLSSRGIPCIYYGTEILLADTTNHGKIRQDFPGGWAGDSTNAFEAKGRSADQERVWKRIQILAKHRQAHPELYRGRFVHFVPDEGVYVYGWVSGKGAMLAVLNRSEKSRKIDLNRYAEVHSGHIMPSLLSQTMLDPTQGSFDCPAGEFEVFYVEF